MNCLHPFEAALSVTGHDTELPCNFPLLAWADFLLNPRRLRGSDFLMRWSQGVWSETRLTQAILETGRFFAIPYGPSGTAPSNNVRDYELYFERLEHAGLGRMKRPDLILFRNEDKKIVDTLLETVGGISELPFTREDSAPIRDLLGLSLIAIECENSLWVAQRMPNYSTPLSPQRRLDKQLGLKKAAVTPTIIVKDEDRERLKLWQETHGVPIHVWHAFFDLAWGLSLDEIERLITTGQIDATIQVFQAPGGATSKKAIYKVYHNHAYPLGETTQEPTLMADSITDANGHILPFVRFEGGGLRLLDPALKVLNEIIKARNGS